MRLTAQEWVGLLDVGSFEEEDADLAPCDPLSFVSPKDNYAQKLRENQERTGMNDAVISGHGMVERNLLQVAICEFGFIGGSMGSVFGEKIARATERAAAEGTPLLTINTSAAGREPNSASCRSASVDTHAVSSRS